jgi:Ca2+/Na+ antiporter
MKENELFIILKEIVARIKNELLLFSIVIIVLMVIFNNYKFWIFSIYVIGLVVYFLSKFYNIREKKKLEDNKHAGIISEGRKALFLNCKGFGLDAGIIDRGEGTKVVGGVYKSIDK